MLLTDRKNLGKTEIKVGSFIMFKVRDITFDIWVNMYTYSCVFIGKIWYVIDIYTACHKKVMHKILKVIFKCLFSKVFFQIC